MTVTSSDTAAMNVREIIKQSTKKHAKKEQLNYVMSCYSSNQRADIMEIVRSVAILYRLNQKYVVLWDAAVK